jgi:hypothetical protein
MNVDRILGELNGRDVEYLLVGGMNSCDRIRVLRRVLGEAIGE